MSKSSGQLLPQGMYVRASGTYAGSFKVDGRWVRRTIGQDREKAIAAFRRFRKSGTAPRASRVTAEQAKQVTVTDVLDLYLAYQRRQRRDKPRSVEAVEYAVERLRKLLDPLAPIGSLTQEDFWVLRDKRAAQVAAVSTNSTLRYLKAALNFSVREGLIQALPFRVEMLPEPAKRNRAITQAQVDRVLAAALDFDARAHAICFLAYSLGLRLSEIITGLWWRDIDLEEQWLQVEAKPGWSPKTRQRRVLTLDDGVTKFLADWRDQVHRTGPNDRVVPRGLRDGDPFTRRWAGELVTKAFRRANVPGGAHSLRHTFVTEALEAGVPVHIVQKLAGHSAVQTTLGHYAHVRDAAMRDAAEMLALKRQRERGR